MNITSQNNIQNRPTNSYLNPQAFKSATEKFFAPFPDILAPFRDAARQAGIQQPGTVNHPPTGGPRPKSVAKMLGAATTHLKAGGKLRQTKVATKAQPGKSVHQTNVASQTQTTSSKTEGRAGVKSTGNQLVVTDPKQSHNLHIQGNDVSGPGFEVRGNSVTINGVKYPS